MSRQKEFIWKKTKTDDYKGNHTYIHRLINFPLYELYFCSYISNKTNSRVYEFINNYGKNIHYNNIDDCIKQTLKSFLFNRINDDYFARYCYSIGKRKVLLHFRYHHYNVATELAHKTVKDYEITALRHKKRFMSLYEKYYSS